MSYVQDIFAEYDWQSIPPATQEGSKDEEFEESIFEYQVIGSEEEPFWGDEVR